MGDGDQDDSPPGRVIWMALLDDRVDADELEDHVEAFAYLLAGEGEPDPPGRC